MTSRRLPVLVLQSLTGWALVGIYLFPIYWMLISGFKTQSEIFANPPTFWPKDFSFDAYDFVFRREDVLRYVRNSVYIAGPVTVIAITLAAIGSYALCRLKSRAVDACIVVILLLQVFPEVLLATPLFIMFKSLDLLNSHWAVILATSARAVAFGLLVLRPMFRQVPIELEEAARIDGCTDFQIFYKIVIPLMRVPLIVMAMLIFAQAYGQFVFPLTLLSDQNMQPGTVGIFGFIGAEAADWHRVMAFSTLFVLPILILFISLQSKIVSGLTAGALK
ncbi:carbohydrate ABC transporter permease [Bosea thiooxidans]|nr:carbohydrate ABC transporter permease [Bosea sp. (in: a-proteobacteria)]